MRSFPYPTSGTQPSEIGRRAFLRIGLGGFAGLTLPQLLQLRAHASTGDKPTAVILVWLRGGASQLETFDPKPLASSEYRGPYDPIATNIAGIQICELFPRLATIANRYTLLRSMSHLAGAHPSGSLAVLSGDPDSKNKPEPRFPDWMTIANYIRSGSPRQIPNYVAVNPVDKYDGVPIAGPAYLGSAFDGFKVLGDPSRPDFEVPNVGLKDESQRSRLLDRVELRQSFERLRSGLDRSGTMQAVDDFQAQAVNLLVSTEASTAFDLSREPDFIRDRYGRHQWGQQCLLARRLVEAGVEIVTTEFDGPLCGRVANWDDHGVNHNIFEAMKFRAPYFDQAVSGLIDDIYQRGLDRRVLVIVAGEFGRTPRIAYAVSTGEGAGSGAKGTVQPGRDHWPRASSMLFAGGGIRGGQVVGATDRRGEDPIERRVGPEDFLATIYRHLGIDFRRVAIPDFSGRPIPIIRDGTPIPELAPQA